MSVQFENYDYRTTRDGKPIFVPSDLGQRIGKDIKAQVESTYAFDDFIYHLRKNGGHVAALHAHRSHQFFARLDIKRFFYSIARNRVRRALAGIGIHRALHYAKWSCVKNPYGIPSYSLPYGFIQSPVLATLVLMESGVGALLRDLATEGRVLPTVYMDDISLSSDDLGALQAAFEKVLARLEEAQFAVSPSKVREPSATMDLFNCDLKSGHTVVRDERVQRFYVEKAGSAASVDAFQRYCESVEVGNI